MRMLISTAIAAALAVSLPACKQQPAGNEAASAEPAAASLDALNGTWKVDLASLKFSGKPYEYGLKDGSWNCASCIPPLTVAADGQFHAVTDQPYYDSMSVKQVDDRTIDIHRKKGDKEVSSSNLQVSEDGNTLTIKFKDMTAPTTIEGSTSFTRAGPAPAGAHAASGQWQPNKIGEYTEEGLDISLQISGDTVTSSSQGQSYTATLGGPAVAMQNDPGGTMVKVERAGNGIKETYSRDGKEVGVATITPSADGKSISYSSTDPRDGTRTDFTANKKS